jgi:hypothetical protein
VNKWWVKINPQAEPECLSCDTGEFESIMHFFWSCIQATTAWSFAFTILSAMLCPGRRLRSFNVQHALFAQHMPRRFQSCRAIWVFLWSVTIWTIWVARNGNIFNQEHWQSRVPFEPVLRIMDRQLGFICRKRRFKLEATRVEVLDKFMAIWTPHAYLCSRVENRVQWNQFTFDPGRGIE